MVHRDERLREKGGRGGESVAQGYHESQSSNSGSQRRATVKEEEG